MAVRANPLIEAHGHKYTSTKYLLVVVGDVDTITMVDVDGAPVLVLQRCAHQQVSEAVVVEIWSSCHSVAEPCILGLFFRLQSSIGHKDLFLHERCGRTGKKVRFSESFQSILASSVVLFTPLRL